MKKSSLLPIECFLLLLAVTIVSNIIIIATPGFYSHDELEKIDFLYKNGFFTYLKTYISIPDTVRFEAPVRPVGYFFWALSLMPMPSYPVLCHLFDVVLHFVVVYFLYRIVIVAGGSQRVALLAAVLFSFSPLTMMSVGWSGALFDRLYVLFSLLTVFYFMKYVKTGGNFVSGVAYLFGMLLCSSLSILSKETALVLPGIVLLTAWYLSSSGSVYRVRDFVIGGLLSGVPVLMYLLLRLQPLINSLTSRGTSYDTSSAYIPGNLLVYWVFPFIPNLSEAHNYTLLPTSTLVLSALLHFSVVSALLWKYGLRAAGIYAASYFIFLLPVLALKSPGSHYLYGSGLVMSIAIAFIGVAEDGKRLKIFACSIIGLSLVHAVKLQLFIYDAGTYQSRILQSLDNVAKSYGPDEIKKGVLIVPDADSKKYILTRAVHRRHRIGNVYDAEITISDDAAKIQEHQGITLRYDKDGDLFSRQQLSRGSEKKPNAGKLTLLRFGPQTIKAGEIFNKQPNGESGLWIKCENATKTTIPVIGGVKLEQAMVESSNLITCLVPKSIYAKPNTYSLFLLDTQTGSRSNDVEVVIK